MKRFFQMTNYLIADTSNNHFFNIVQNLSVPKDPSNEGETRNLYDRLKAFIEKKHKSSKYNLY